MTRHDARSEPRSPGRSEISAPLASQIKDQIVLRASGRIHDLHVVCSDQAIVLQGWSRTYHAKQIAQEAALDLIDDRTLPRFLNQIVVA